MYSFPLFGEKKKKREREREREQTTGTFQPIKLLPDIFCDCFHRLLLCGL